MKDNAKEENDRSLLRRRMKETLSSLGKEYISGSSIHICEFLKKYIRSKDGVKDVFIYNSYGSEVKTDKIILFLSDGGFNVYLPIVRGDDMYAVAVNKDTKYVIGDYGISEPLGEAYTGGFDMAVTPMLAFDKDKNRMGKGKGYYDRFFASHDVKIKVGLAFSAQETVSVYPESHDVPMDVIITEEGICE